MVRDKLGRKMSKQLGNSPDLLELIERFGADAVRFGIMISSPAGNDLLFDDTSCEQGRNFNNKMWNALKLVKMWKPAENTGAPVSTLAVEWFENRLNEAHAEVEKLIRDFRLSEALKTIYSLIWDDFCSWYLEWIKPGFEQPIDAGVYEKTIGFYERLVQLLHPFMPFVTEEIYHLLRDRAAGDDLVIRQFAAPSAAHKGILAEGALAKEVITAIRDARNKNQIKPKDSIALHIETRHENAFQKIESILAKQVNANVISYTKEPVTGAITLVVQKDKFYIVTENKVDTATQKEQLLRDLEYQQGFLQSVEKKLSNERFVQNARPEAVEAERRKQADCIARIQVIEESLKSL